MFISGRVQGVFFRAYTRERAQSLGVYGWVGNCPDGRVEAVFEGREEAVDQIIAWCREGPPYARVNKVDISWEEYQGEFSGFIIKGW